MFMPEGKLDLGTPPRHCYPLVIFLIRDIPENSTLHPDETVSLLRSTDLFLVHVDLCTFGKQTDEQIRSLYIIL